MLFRSPRIPPANVLSLSGKPPRFLCLKTNGSRKEVVSAKRSRNYEIPPRWQPSRNPPPGLSRHKNYNDYDTCINPSATPSPKHEQFRPRTLCGNPSGRTGYPRSSCLEKPLPSRSQYIISYTPTPMLPPQKPDSRPP